MPNGRATALYVPVLTVCPPNGKNAGRALDTVRYAIKMADIIITTLLK